MSAPVALSPPPLELGRRTRAVTAFLGGPLSWLVAGFAVVLVLAPVLATHDPVQADVASKLAPPSADHFFGTDSYGMDIFSRVLVATRADFAAAVSAVGIAAGIGLPLGVLAGYLGGIVDDLINRVAEAIQALPQFLFAMAVLAVFGSGFANMVLVIAFFTFPGYVKLVRSMVLGLARADFVLAARCSGASTPRIVQRHLLPNTIAPFFGQLSISCAFTIQTIAGLSFLGLGVEAPEPEWGSMINTGAPYMVSGQWWAATFPILAVVLAVVMLRSVGERFRRRYEREL